MLPIQTSLIIGIALKLRENWRKEVEPLPAPLRYAGFTLIELSIVLVIIGLIVGGVLVGQDLIEAAKLRSQLSQIESYNTAANTFRIKYSGLPGDLRNAAALGFQARTVANIGNGDRFINASTSMPNSMIFERVLFWRDLTEAQLIDGNFIYATGTTVGNPADGLTMPQDEIQRYIPKSKVNDNAYVAIAGQAFSNLQAPNQFIVSKVLHFQRTGLFVLDNTTLSPLQIKSLDTKIDDGLPTQGRVKAVRISIFTIDDGSQGDCVDNLVTPPVYKTSSEYVCNASIKATF